MIFTFDQKKKARNQFNENLSDMNDAGVSNAANSGDAKFKKLNDDPPNALVGMWEAIKLLISLLKDYTSGKYTDIAWKTIAAVAAAILYFVSPIDVIPDFIPGLGFLDDAAVVGYALQLIGNDLANYKLWKNL